MVRVEAFEASTKEVVSEGGEEKKKGKRAFSLFLLLALALTLALTSGARETVAQQQAVASGKVVAWGDDSEGQSTVPTGLSGVKAVAGGTYHSLALKENGEVVAWGKNLNHQTDVPDDAKSGVKAIAAGNAHSLALKENGEVVAWGDDSVEQSTVPDSLSGVKVKAIAAGYFHNLALKENGEVVAWGEDTWGQLNVHGDAKSGVKAIAAGYYHSLALKEDGQVLAWGSGSFQQSTVPDSLNGVKVKAVAGGAFHSLALKEDGGVVAWGGDDYNNQSIVPDGAKSGVKAIAGGGLHSLALKEDGKVLAWGSGSEGQSTVPTGLKEAEAIGAGIYHSLAIDAPTPPGSVELFEADGGEGRASLSWSNPSDADFEAVRILRSETGPATGPEPNAGQTQVYEGKAESFEDTNLTNGKTYYYTAYAKDDAGLWSARATAQATPADTTAPSVTGTYPAGDQRGVPRGTVVTATFSEAMNEASVEAVGVFTLKKKGASGPVGATVTYDPDTKTLTLDPSRRLGKGATYTATITTQAQDAAGNALAVQKIWSFKTKRR